MKKFIELLERKISGCDALGGLEREKAVYQSVLKDYKKQLTLTDVGCSLPKVCTGCGTLSTKVIDEKYLACCPDNQYIKLEDYCKKSVYKPELFNK